MSRARRKADGHGRRWETWRKEWIDNAAKDPGFVAAFFLSPLVRVLYVLGGLFGAAIGGVERRVRRRYAARFEK